MQFVARFIIFIFLLMISFSAAANLPYFPIQFPRDEVAHYEDVPYPVTNMMEWWYYNGTLTSKTGRRIGYYLSFNYVQRIINGVKVILPVFQVQITDIDTKKIYSKELFFPDKNSYSMSTKTLDVAFGKNLTLRKDYNSYYLDINFDAKEGAKIAMSLRLTPTRAPLLIGKTGLVDMWDNTNSYYYSFTHVVTEGYVQIGNEMLDLDAQHSLSWMDHQWGDFITLPGLNQWMWTSIQLANGIEINLGTILDNVTKKVHSGTANIVMPNGAHIYLLHPEQFSYTPNFISGGSYPLTYNLLIPVINLKLTLTALAPNQAANDIWEGVSSAEGTYQGYAVSGQAYTENTVKY